MLGLMVHWSVHNHQNLKISQSLRGQQTNSLISYDRKSLACEQWFLYFLHSLSVMFFRGEGRTERHEDRQDKPHQAWGRELIVQWTGNVGAPVWITLHSCLPAGICIQYEKPVVELCDRYNMEKCQRDRCAAAGCLVRPLKGWGQSEPLSEQLNCFLWEKYDSGFVPCCVEDKCVSCSKTFSLLVCQQRGRYHMKICVQ